MEDRTAQDDHACQAWDRVRIVAVASLAASIPLAGLVGIPVGVGQKKPVDLVLFDVMVWLCLVLALVVRLRREGFRGTLALLKEVPLAAWFLCLLTAWSGLVWPHLSGLPPVSTVAVSKKLLPLVEYGLLIFVVAGELARGGAERRVTLLALAGATGLAILGAVIQYFGAAEPVNVGSFFGELDGRGKLVPNRNALGAFLAISVPFFGVLALRGRSLWQTVAWAAIAGGGTLMALAGGALLGIACGALAGAALLGGRRLAVATGVLAVLFGLSQLLPRHGLSSAAKSVRLERTCPISGEELLSLRYLRAGAELNVLRAPFRASDPERNLFFGVGPGAYTERSKRFRPHFDDRPAGETGKVENYDVLADEPGTFNLFGTAAAEMGLLGLLGFLWLFAELAGRSLAAWRAGGDAGSEPTLAAAAFAAVIGAVVVSPFASSWIRGSGPMLTILVAVFCPIVVRHAIPSYTHDSDLHQ